MSINKVILVGNVGSDPEVKTIGEQQNKVANFSLATSERGYTTKDGRQIPERTDWHNITAYNGPAKVVEAYVRKGSKIYVEGKIRSRSYNGQDGQKHYITEIIVETIELLDRKVTGAAPPGASPAPTTVSATDPANKDDLPF